MYFKRYFLLILSIMLATLLSAKEPFDVLVNKYQPNTEKGLIYIDKSDFSLTVFSPSGDILVEYPIACGMNIGQKRRAGDHKTPEGVFEIQEIQDSSKWGHDFHDGKGFIKHAYGPWFFRIKTGFKGIGIHGTHDPESIGTRATEGCVRLKNENLESLKQFIEIGMTVIISQDKI